MNNEKKELINNLFKYVPTKEQLDYYYIDDNVFCCDINLKPMFDNVDVYDYIAPINKLYNYFNVQYYENLYNKYKNHKFDNPLFIEQYDEELDDIFLNYINPYDQNLTYYYWLENSGYKPSNPKFYHYGADAHLAWADFILPNIQRLLTTNE